MDWKSKHSLFSLMFCSDTAVQFFKKIFVRTPSKAELKMSLKTLLNVLKAFFETNIYSI